jgi:Tfp pilus assembly ATPase PilU
MEFVLNAHPQNNNEVCDVIIPLNFTHEINEFMKKQKQKQKREDVVEIVSSNKFVSNQKVFEGNLKEFLVLILHLFVFTIKSL